MPFFDEDPFGRITDVHWPEQDCPPQPRPSAPHYCGYYGWGSVYDNGQRFPLGDHQYPPFLGQTNPFGDNTVGELDCGGLYSGGYSDNWFPPDGFLATGHDTAFSLSLILSGLVFSNDTLYWEPRIEGRSPAFWIVPMVQGDTYVGVFGSCQHIYASRVIDKFTINMQWQFAGQPGEIGLGFSRGIPPPGNPDGWSWPPAPQVVMGARAGGEFSYTYDMNAWEWFTTEFMHGHGYTYENQWDLSGGGPVQLWIFYSTAEGGWAINSADFLGGAMRTTGDFHEWEVVAHCQDAFTAADVGPPMPPDPEGPVLRSAARARPYRPLGPLAHWDAGWPFTRLPPSDLSLLLPGTPAARQRRLRRR